MKVFLGNLCDARLSKVSLKSGVRWSAQVSISLVPGLARDLCAERGVMCLSFTCSDEILRSKKSVN